jgi:hypothetical protein
MDYQLIFFLLFFVLWLYVVELSLENKSKNKAFIYMQFILCVPLVIFIGSNAYAQSFIFGYVFCLIPLIISVYILSTIFSKK